MATTATCFTIITGASSKRWNFNLIVVRVTSSKSCIHTPDILKESYPNQPHDSNTSRIHDVSVVRDRFEVDTIYEGNIMTVMCYFACSKLIKNCVSIIFNWAALKLHYTAHLLNVLLSPIAFMLLKRQLCIINEHIRNYRRINELSGTICHRH